MWQEVGVVLIVGAAVVYLARKVFGAGPRPRPTRSFVPLTDLKRKR
jgi:hypothetical protein